MTSPTAQITLRPARADDAASVRRLAALDSAPVPAPPLLLAEADGALRAALSIASGTAVADPFYRSAGLVTLLRAHPATSGQPPVERRAVALRASRRRPRPDLARC